MALAVHSRVKCTRVTSNEEVRGLVVVCVGRARRCVQEAARLQDPLSFVGLRCVLCLLCLRALVLRLLVFRRMAGWASGPDAAAALVFGGLLQCLCHKLWSGVAVGFPAMCAATARRCVVVECLAPLLALVHWLAAVCVRARGGVGPVCGARVMARLAGTRRKRSCGV